MFSRFGVSYTPRFRGCMAEDALRSSKNLFIEVAGHAPAQREPLEVEVVGAGMG